MFNSIKSFFTSKPTEQPQQNQSYSQQNNCNNCNDDQAQYNESPYTGSTSSNVTLLKPFDKEKKVVAVIVSFVSGSTYDSLFTSVQQKVQEGTQVLVYSCHSGSIKDIDDGFSKEASKQEIKQMVKYIKQVDPDCVVFNWQCSSGYGASNFSQGTNLLFTFVRKMIDRGHMCMFSDFSLKALITQWNQKIMGPNPFVKVSETSESFDLSFDNQVLKRCPSAQLQIIGEMAQDGHCHVEAMGGTIVYGLNKSKSDNKHYKVQILTVVTTLKHSNTVSIKDKEGQAGHILLTYPSGGCLLTSMGHWIQLMKIDTSQKVLFEIAAKEYGNQRAQQMRMEYDVLGAQEKCAYISRNAVDFVQSSAPCANMAKKARSKY